MDFFATLVSTFFGALAAFLLEAWRRRGEEVKKRHEAILAAQATLISQFNSVLSILKQLEAAEGANPFENLKTSVIRLSPRSIEFPSLGFLAASSQPHLLLDI